MAIRVRIKKVDTSAVRRRFRAMRRRSRNVRPVLRWALRELEREHLKNFNSGGALAGGWAPLDNEYAAWKLANYGAGGILVLDGDLKAGLTRWGGKGAVREIKKTKATFGVKHEAVKFHQYGTSKMARRKVVFLPNRFAFGVAEATAEHIVYGGKIGSTYQHLKAGFRT